jgi:N-acetyl-anhydromuramyl-L-alanine amidase AmpD
MGIIVVDKTSLTSQWVMQPHPLGYNGWGGLILHHTGDQGPSSEEETYLWLSRFHANPVSIHKLFHRDGRVTLIVPLNYRAWHAGRSLLNGREDCTSWTIGYEICHTGNPSVPYTPAQYESVSVSAAYDIARFKSFSDALVSSHCRIRRAWVAAHPVLASRLHIQDKNDPINWGWSRMWERVDQIRASWPADWPFPEWHRAGQRVMRTAP